MELCVKKKKKTRDQWKHDKLTDKKGKTFYFSCGEIDLSYFKSKHILLYMQMPWVTYVCCKYFLFVFIPFYFNIKNRLSC